MYNQDNPSRAHAFATVVTAVINHINLNVKNCAQLAARPFFKTNAKNAVGKFAKKIVLTELSPGDFLETVYNYLVSTKLDAAVISREWMLARLDADLATPLQTMTFKKKKGNGAPTIDAIVQQLLAELCSLVYRVMKG